MHATKLYYSVVEGDRPVFDMESEVHTWLYADIGIQGLGVLSDETMVFTSITKHQVLCERDGHSTVTLAVSDIAGWDETRQFRT